MSEGSNPPSKWLLLNHSPVSSHVTSLLQPLCPDPEPNPNPNQYPELYPNPHPIPNPNPTEKRSLFSRLAEHWSRDHIKISFSPTTPQGCILPYVMRGYSESASKNTSKPIFKYPKYSNIRISENSLASDLVFVQTLTLTLTNTPNHTLTLTRSHILTRPRYEVISPV